MKYAFCVICNTTENIEHHHITPVCKGGDDHPHNFISLCVEHHGMIHSLRPGSWAHRKKLQRIGIDKAKKAGKYKGRKPSIDRKELKRLWDSGLSAIEIAKQMNINRTTVYRLLPKEPYKKLKNGQYKLF
jgi:hypothetical protein|tara:strand:+ start:96 stop:485 length:390 start_codon:yes stop_codon:yes gene_type:complete